MRGIIIAAALSSVLCGRVFADEERGMASQLAVANSVNSFCKDVETRWGVVFELEREVIPKDMIATPSRLLTIPGYKFGKDKFKEWVATSGLSSTCEQILLEAPGLFKLR